MAFEILENSFLQQLSKPFRRAPEQINQLLQSDAELVRLPDGSVLAVTTDCIAEEISTGLYSDPEHIGWMTVLVNLSDLAAVGAKPIGLLLSESLPKNFPEAKLQAVQVGIAAACTAMGTFVLGGDTNFSNEWQMGGTAIGLIPANEPVITRKGIGVGDILFCSATMGLGSAFAFEVLLGADEEPVPYRPIARLKEGALVRKYGSSCIDTSDGFFHALSNLFEVNEIGFQLDIPLSSMTHPAALRISQTKRMPAWFFLAGPHGEFELLFTIPKKNEKLFLEAAQQLPWKPLRLGSCTPAKDCMMRTKKGESMPLYPIEIANAYEGSGGNPQIFLTQLINLEAKWQIEKVTE